MDIQSLPQYRGLPDAPRGWGEPDERGNTPRMCLRDYAALSLIIMVCFPISLCLEAHFWARHRFANALNAAREEELGRERYRQAGGGNGRSASGGTCFILKL